MFRAVARKLTGRTSFIVAVFGIVFAGACVVLFLVDLQSRYRAAIASAKQTTRNYAAVLAADAARTLEGVDRSLRVAEIAHRSADVGPRASAAERLSATRRA